MKCCRKCPVKDIKGYCDDCKVFFCKECMEDHIDHEIVSTKKFCEGKKKDILSQVSELELSSQLKEKMQRTLEKRENLNKNQNDITKEIASKEVLVGENKDGCLKQELGRLEAATKYLTELEKEALTVTLKDACEDAMKHFNLEDKIRGEFETLENNLADARRRVKEMDKEIGNLKEELEVLTYLKGENGKYELNNEKWTAFLLMNWGVSSSTTPSKCEPEIVSSEFKAFPFVGNVFDIKDVMEKDLIDLGQGVKMTEPLRVDKGLITGDSVFASLSHQGVLFICVDDDTVQFTDLNNNRQVRMTVENYSLAGFYNDMVILLVCNVPLMEAIMENVFEDPNIEIFKEIEGTSNVDPHTDVSLLHERRVLYYPTYDHKLFSFNVDTRKNTEINVERTIYSIASFTGIDCGVKAVFQDNDDYCTYTLNMDDTLTRVDERQDDDWLTALLSSSSNPRNITDAVFKYGWDLIKCEDKIDTSNLIEFEANYSVIRVYGDIFLAYDNNTESWYLLRIIVP